MFCTKIYSKLFKYEHNKSVTGQQLQMIKTMLVQKSHEKYILACLNTPDEYIIIRLNLLIRAQTKKGVQSAIKASITHFQSYNLLYM